MHTLPQRNTDDLTNNSTVFPTEETPRTLIDVHIYHLPEKQPGETDEDLVNLIDQTIAARDEEMQESPVEEWQHPKVTVVLKRRTLTPLFVVLVVVGIGLVLGGSFITYLLFFAPQDTTVTVIPKSVYTQATTTLILDTTGQTTGADHVPGRLLPTITMSQALTVPTTGITHQEARPGRGTITLYNAALYAQTIAAGTLLTGADGIQIATDYAVTVPAAQYPTFGTTSVPAHAIQTGAGGNIKAGDIYGSCCLVNIQAANSAFAGGQAAQTYRSVAQSDIDTAAGNLQTSLTQSITTALQTQVQPTETLAVPLSCQPTITTDQSVGAKAVSVQVTVTQACTGMTYATASVTHLLRNQHIQAAPHELMTHYRLLDQMQTTIQTITTGSTPGEYSLAVQSTGTWVYQFSSSELATFIRHIAGKTTREATQYLLHRPGVQQVSWSVTTTTLPSDAGKIHFLFVTQE